MVFAKREYPAENYVVNRLTFGEQAGDSAGDVLKLSHMPCKIKYFSGFHQNIIQHATAACNRHYIAGCLGAIGRVERSTGPFLHLNWEAFLITASLCRDQEADRKRRHHPHPLSRFHYQPTSVRHSIQNHQGHVLCTAP